MARNEKDIVVSNFQRGTAASPSLGLGVVWNADIYSFPGELRINYATTKKSSTTVTDLIKWFVRIPTNGDIYGLGDTGKIWRSQDGGSSWGLISGNTTSNAHGNGLGYFKGYLIVARDTVLDAFDLGSTWTSAFATITSDTLFHPILNGQDDILYIGSGRYVSSLLEKTGQTFNPASGTTFTFTASALTLPANYRVKCLAELGKNLLVGTWMGTDGNLPQFKIADIFPWDRVSATFNLPFRLPENGINQMIQQNNLVYIVAGISHRVYVYNGASVVPLVDLPPYVTGLYSTGGLYLEPAPGAIGIHQGKLFTGMSAGSNSNSIKGVGIWSVTEQGILVFENQISTGTTSSNNSLKIGAFLSVTRDIAVIAWQDNATYGVDIIDNSTRYTGYVAYVDSELFHVGEPDAKREFDKVLINLAQPLANGEGVTIQYRTSLTGTFVNASSEGAFDFATYGAIQSISQTFNSPVSLENIQLRIKLTTTSGSTPQLTSVIVR